MEEKILTAANENTCCFFGLQHPEIYTQGIKTQKEHILSSKINIVSARRGGSITLHNPGQLILYTIIPLKYITTGLETYIRYLESVMIEVLFQMNINAFCIPEHSGVWTNKGKIGFVGIGVKKKTVFHGISLNINNDLSGYKKIISCGLPLPVTKLSELNDIYGKKINISEDIFERISRKMSRLLQTRLMPTVKMTLKSHLQYYEKYFRSSSLSLKIGMLYFNCQKYWHAHEVWEFFWRLYKNTEYGRFQMGLIQLSSGLYKLNEKINIIGSLSQIKKAREKLYDNQYTNKALYSSDSDKNIIEYIDLLISRIERLNITENTKSSKEIAKKIFSPYLIVLKSDYESII